MIAIGSGDKANVARGQKALGLVPDGVFGRGTQSAVLAYQRARGLPASGAFDKATWNTLVPGGTTGAPTSVVTPAPAGSGANSTPPGTAPGRTTAVPAAAAISMPALPSPMSLQCSVVGECSGSSCRYRRSDRQYGCANCSRMTTAERAGRSRSATPAVGTR